MGEAKPVSVLVADDHEMFRAGVAGMLSSSGRCVVVAQAAAAARFALESGRLHRSVKRAGLGVEQSHARSASRDASNASQYAIVLP